MTGEAYDVMVVGARIAGSSLAALLGDAGHRVLLVDSGTFPSPTLSTHFFRGAGFGSVLKRLGVLDEVLSLGSPPLTCQYVHLDGMEPAVAPAQDPGEIGYCLSVRREPLDHLLLQRACRSGMVTFLDRTRVTGLIREGERVVGAWLSTAGEERAVRARITVGADGRHSFVARAVEAKKEAADPATRAIYYIYVRGFAGPQGQPPDGPEFSFLGDEIAYVFPSDDGVTCIALSVNLGMFAEIKARHAEAFRERLRDHKGLAERFAASEPIGRILGHGPHENYVRIPAGPGWALVGDAGLHQDPWSGMGMDMAGVHAGFLAEALADYLSGSSTEFEALDLYHRRRNQHGLAGYHTTVQVARDLRQLSQGYDQA